MVGHELCLISFAFLFTKAVSSEDSNSFRAVLVDDLRLADVSFVIGAFDPLSCARLCVEKPAGCRGFHVDLDRRCYLFSGSGEKMWKEREAPVLKVWIWHENTASRCPANFRKSRGRSRYKLVNQSMRWLAAKVSCHSKASKLLQISTEKERIFVRESFRGLRPSVWTGGHGKMSVFDDEIDWFWDRSNDVMDTSRWWLKSPINATSLLYAALQTNNGLLVNREESRALFFVCECILF